MKPEIHHPTSEDLFAYRDGELSSERRSLIEAHVLACRHCCDQIDEMSALESDLKLRPDGVDAAYFETMTESVLSRVASAPPPEPEAMAPIERRRPIAPDEEFGTRRRLRMPWIGIAGTGAAAVAVALVAVLLLNRQDEWVRAPRPDVVGSRGEAKADRDAAGSKARERRDAGRTSAGTADGALQKPAARTEEKKKVVAILEKPAATPALEPQVVAGSALRGAKDEASKQIANETSGNDAARDIREGEVGFAEPEAQQKRSASAPAPALAFGRAPGEPYARVLREHGLPVLWDEGVPTDALLSAEPDLRLVYQTRKAGADSARIRLYIAEAERAKIGNPPDRSRVESVAHHYRRAIALARGDAELQAIARRRLGELLMTAPPANAEPESGETDDLPPTEP